MRTEPKGFRVRAGDLQIRTAASFKSHLETMEIIRPRGRTQSLKPGKKIFIRSIQPEVQCFSTNILRQTRFYNALHTQVCAKVSEDG